MTCEWVYKRGERQSETVDSESSRSLRSGLHAEVRADRHVPGSFELVVDGTPQSHVDLGDPTHLFYEYVRRMGHVIDQLPAGPLTAVHLGAGALTLPRYIEATRPGSRQQVVELEPDLIELVREALPFPRGASIRMRYGDAREVLRKLPAGVRGSVDLLVVDVFGGARIPAHTITRAEPADHGFDSARLTDALEFAATQEITASKDLTEMIPKGERHPYDRQLGQIKSIPPVGL